MRQVGRGYKALAAVEEFRPEILVLDLMLPGRSGLDVLRELRESDESLPVLVLTAKGDVVDRVVGLELGADDYLPKPFAERELLARVRALLRRRRRTGPEPARDAPHEIVLSGIRFDYLIANRDRNVGNILVDANWGLVLVDHTRSFSVLASPPELPDRFDRRMIKALRRLDPSSLQANLKGLLTEAQTEGFWERRDALLAHVETLVEERGEQNVLF